MVCLLTYRIATKIGVPKNPVTADKGISDAVKLLEILRDLYPEKLEERYKIKDFGEFSGYEILEEIGRKRGMLVSKGEVNTLRAATTLFDELRGGKLGKISFEKP